MSGWALRACVQIVLESRRGQWCTPAWIAGRVIVSIDTVAHTCEALVGLGHAQFKLGEGTPLFGIDVFEDHAVVNDVSDVAQACAEQAS